MESPSLAESDVREADGAPGEKRSETRELEEPVEDGLTGRNQVHVAECAHEKDDADGGQGSAGAVNVGEDLGSVSLLSEGSEGTGASINTRDTNGDDGDENDDVHEVVKTLQSCKLASNDEGRRLGVTGAGAEEFRVIGRDEKTNEEETEDVETGKRHQ